MNLDPGTLFAALSHDTRLRCLMLLQAFDELCVCELTYAIGAVQPHMSRHLAYLREHGLVTDRRAGQWIHYRINPALPAWVADVLAQTAQGVEMQAPFSSDRRALSHRPDRPGTPRCA